MGSGQGLEVIRLQNFHVKNTERNGKIYIENPKTTDLQPEMLGMIWKDTLPDLEQKLAVEFFGNPEWDYPTLYNKKDVQPYLRSNCERVLDKRVSSSPAFYEQLGKGMTELIAAGYWGNGDSAKTRHAAEALRNYANYYGSALKTTQGSCSSQAFGRLKAEGLAESLRQAETNRVVFAGLMKQLGIDVAKR